MKSLVILLLLLLLSTAVFSQTNLKKASQLIEQGQWQKARSLLKPIANKGDHKAQFLLGTTYSGRDEIQAFKWYMKSAKQGYDQSQLYVGKMYSFGLGVKQNTEKAIFWYQHAAKRGNKIAKQNLDYLLQITKTYSKQK